MNAVQQRSIALLWNGSSGWSDSDQTRLKIQSVLSQSGSTVEVRQVERGMNIVEESKAIVAGASTCWLLPEGTALSTQRRRRSSISQLRLA